MNALFTTGVGQWNLVSFLIEKLGVEGKPAATAVTLGGVLLCMVIPYLLGSFNFGLIISNKKYNDDIRTHGSGNAGTTNMLRTYGKGAAILTMLGDMLKAVVAVALGYLILNLNVVSADGASPASDPLGAAIAGLFVMLGHMFPCFFKFKGGKGVATAAMVILMIHPISFVVCLLTFIIIVVGTKFVSLGSIMGLILYPIVLNAFEPSRGSNVFAIIMAVLVVWAHRENIKRLLAGKESKISLFKKKPAPDTDTAQEAQPTPPTPDEPTSPEQEDAFVTCTGCGKLIPVSRKVCAYCNTPNPHYRPDPAEAGGKKKKNKKKKK